MKRIDVRCPACKDWQKVSGEALGMPCVCPNCRQTVTMVPRSSQARKWRVFLKVLIVLGGVWLFFYLRNAREERLTGAISPTELSDGPH